MPNHDDHNGHENGEFDPVTRLYIRTHPADDGTEPLPAALPQWQSPDILIHQPGGAVGFEAIANQLNQVQVIVTNGGGITAVDAFIDLFFADPSTAFTPATATLIGGNYLTISGYSTDSIFFPWTPSTADAGHRCLLARVALYIPPDLYADGTIFDARGDRHVAQRNINVLALAANQKSIRFGFAIVNPFQKSMQMRLVAREVRAVAAQRLLREGLGCRFAQFGETPLQNFGLLLGKEVLHVPSLENPLELLGADFRLKGVGVLRQTGAVDAQSRMRAEMAPGEVHQGIFYVERNFDTRPGDLHAIDIVQTADDGVVVGGLTVVVQH